MNQKENYYKQLLYSSTTDKLFEKVDEFIREESFDSINALIDYFNYCTINEIKVELIHRSTAISDLRQKFQFLINASYDIEHDVILEVLYVMEGLKHPAFAHRLFSIFQRSKTEDKKILVLKILTGSGVSLFIPWFIENFPGESLRVQNYILIYIINIPFLKKEESKSLCKVIQGMIERAEDSVEEGKHFYHLWMLQLNNPELKKKCIRILNKSKFSYSIYYHLFQQGSLADDVGTTSTKIMEALEEKDPVLIHRVRFSEKAIKSLIIPLEKKFKKMEKDFQPGDNIFIWNLIRFNHSIMFDVMMNYFIESDSIIFKQVLMDVMVFLPLDEDRKMILQKSCFNLLNEKKHISIFESLTRNIILLFHQDGLKKIYEYFEKCEDSDLRLRVLSGITHAIKSFGYGNSMSALDLYTLNMIIGNGVDFITSKDDHNPLLASKVFRLIHLVGNDTYLDELTTYVEKHGLSVDIIKAIVIVNNDMSMDLLVSILKDCLEDTILNSGVIHTAFSEMNRRKVKFAERITEDIILTLLDQPPFTAEIIYFIYKHQKKKYLDKVLQYASIPVVQQQHHFLLYLSQFNPQEHREIIWEMFQQKEWFIKVRAGFLLLTIPDKKLAGEIFKEFLSRGKWEVLGDLIKKLPVDETLVQIHISVLEENQKNLKGSHS